MQVIPANIIKVRKIKLHEIIAEGLTVACVVMQCSQDPEINRCPETFKFTVSFRIRFNIIFPPMTGSDKWYLPFGFSGYTYCEFLVAFVHAAFPAHLVLLGMTTVVTFGKGNRFYSCRYSVLSSILIGHLSYVQIFYL